VVIDFFRRRKLTDDMKRRLLVGLARSQEALIDTHVQNVFDLIDDLEELPIEKVLEIYLDELDLDDTQATRIARKVLTRFER